MKNNSKIIISVLSLIIIVSMLFFVVPITGKFIVSYIFTLIAIISIALSLSVFNNHKNTKAPYGWSYIYTALGYALLNIVFSVIACITTLSLVWTIFIHIILLGIFAIRMIMILSGSEYINKLDKYADEKHRNFVKEKENYWK